MNLQMDVFHVSSILIAIIGKRFGTVGLKDVCIETYLIGRGSIDRMIKKKTVSGALNYL